MLAFAAAVGAAALGGLVLVVAGPGSDEDDDAPSGGGDRAGTTGSGPVTDPTEDAGPPLGTGDAADERRSLHAVLAAHPEVFLGAATRDDERLAVAVAAGAMTDAVRLLADRDPAGYVLDECRLTADAVDDVRDAVADELGARARFATSFDARRCQVQVLVAGLDDEEVAAAQARLGADVALVPVADLGRDRPTSTAAPRSADRAEAVRTEGHGDGLVSSAGPTTVGSMSVADRCTGVARRHAEG